MNARLTAEEILPSPEWSECLRTQPWTDSRNNPEDRYHNFKSEPELISQVMSEWKPWAHYEAVQKFYRFLTWLNAPESPFESNDSRFVGPCPNDYEAWPKKLKCEGLLMFFFEQLDLNLCDGEIEVELDPTMPYLPPSKPMRWLRETAHRHLQEAQPDLKWGCVHSSLYPTKYVRLYNKCQYGHEIDFQFWAFGDTEEETMDNVGLVFEAVEESLKKTADEAMVEFPGCEVRYVDDVSRLIAFLEDMQAQPINIVPAPSLNTVDFAPVVEGEAQQEIPSFQSYLEEGKSADKEQISPIPPLRFRRRRSRTLDNDEPASPIESEEQS